MGDESVIEGEVPQDIENITLDKLTPDKVQEFLPGWVYKPDEKLKSGGSGFVFAKSAGGKEWNLIIDKAYRQVTLSSSADDEIRVPDTGDEVLINRRNKELRFHGGRASYTIWKSGRHVADQGRFRAQIVVPEV